MSMISLPNLSIQFKDDFYSLPKANSLNQKLIDEIAWSQNKIKMFGKIYDEPRLSAWYGDEKVTYKYSGIQLTPIKWTNTLLEIKHRIEQETTQSFNSVLLNYYRNGKDYMGWHSDDEKELGKNPIIASLSFGASRSFQLRRKENHKIKHAIELTSGSLLIMKGETQHYWQHQLPKRLKVKEGRINLTFRSVSI